MDVYLKSFLHNPHVGGHVTMATAIINSASCDNYEVCKIGESNRKVDLLRKVGKPITRRARDLWCLHELIHCVGEYAMNYIVADKLLQYNL